MRAQANRFKALQWGLHPDKFAMATTEQADRATEVSSLVNLSYKTLQAPLKRGLYLLELAGRPVTEETQVADMEFLMELMELNEAIDEAEGEELQRVHALASASFDAAAEAARAAFAAEDWEAASNAVVRMRYYDNASRKAGERLP